MLRPSLSILIAAALSVVAYAGDIPGGTVVDLKESTADFVRLFDETCFQHRDQLEALRTIATQRGWEKYPGPFPYRHQDSTAQIVWGFRENGVTYQASLSVFDISAPAITYGFTSFALDKNTLVKRMRDRFEMHISKEVTIGEQDFTFFEMTSDPSLRVTCATATPQPVFVGQCALVRLVQKGAFGTLLSHRFAKAMSWHSASMATAIEG